MSRVCCCIVSFLLAGCSTVAFEGMVDGRHAPSATMRYRIVDLEVRPAARDIMNAAVPVVQLSGALPEEDVNAVAMEKYPKVFAAGKDAIPIRVVVDQEKDACSGQGTEVVNGFTLGLIPAKLTTDTSVRVTVSVFGVEKPSVLTFKTSFWLALTNPIVLSFGSPENESHPAFSHSGLGLNAIDEGKGASKVFAESVAAAVAKALAEQEASGAYFAAKNNLRPDAAVGEKYGILLDKGLISKDEYEQAIVRYAELRDPSRVAIDIGRLRDQGVISKEDYRQEILKAFGAKTEGDRDEGEKDTK